VFFSTTAVIDERMWEEIWEDGSVRVCRVLLQDEMRREFL
jgi:hypothetical protein